MEKKKHSEMENMQRDCKCTMRWKKYAIKWKMCNEIQKYAIRSKYAMRLKLHNEMEKCANS